MIDDGSSSQTIDLSSLVPLVDKLSQVSLDIPQNKIYATALCEYIQSAYQQVVLYEHLLNTDRENPFISTMSHVDVKDVVKTVSEAAEYLLEVLEKDPQFARKEDAQNDYMFEREDREQVGIMKIRILNIQRAVNTANANSENEVSKRKNLTFDQVFQFDLHSRMYQSKNGVVHPDELTNDPRTFHLIGNENSGGRVQLMKKLFHVLHTQIAQQKEIQSQQTGKVPLNPADSLARNAAQRLKVILVQGVTGVGKSNFCVQLCRELCKEFPDNVQRKFHVRLRANTKFSLTTTEAMQQVIQTWHVGPLPIHEKQLRDLYQQSFIGVTTVLYLEDPSNIHQVLALLPNIKYSPSSRAFVVISSRSQLKLDLDRFSKGYIDLVTDGGVKQIRDRIPETNTSLEGYIAADQHDLDEFSDHESDFETDDEDNDDDDDNKKKDETESEKYHLRKTPQQKKMEKELKEIFGSSKKKTFAIHMGIKNDDEKIPMFQRQFDVIYCNLEPLSYDCGAEMMQNLNPKLQNEQTRSISALAENLPIFMKVIIRSQMLYGGDLADYSIAVGTFMDRYARTNFPQLRKLCQGFFIGIWKKWEKPLQDFAIKLSIFPFSFDAVSASLILEVPLHETLKYLQFLIFVGMVCQNETGRFSMHDLVRDTFQIYKDEELKDSDEVKVSMSEAEERYVQHYYNLLRLYNMQHEYSGIIYMPGPERYDMDIENMKYVVEFLKGLGNSDYVDALNTGRYIFRNVIFAIDRGRLYTFLESNAAVDKLQDEFGKAYFYEGFALIYYDLMDHKNAFLKAKKSLELLENACILSDIPSDELKQLPILLLTGDIAFRQHQHDIALKYFEKMVTIATRHAHDWQKIKVDKTSSDPFAIVSGFEDEEYIVKDIFIGKSYIAQAKIYMQRGDIKNGKKYFERGLTIMQRIYHRYHPFISDAFASYAQLLRDFKSSQFYEDVCKYYKDAIEIDAKIFGEDSFSVSEKLDGYAVALTLQNNYEAAEPIFKRTLNLRKRFFGENDITVSSTHNNLAVCLKHLRRPDEAKTHYEAALNILIGLFGQNDSRVATIKTNIAKLKLEFSESYEDAEKTFQEALETLKDENINEKGRQMASTLTSLGDASRHKQDFTKALEYYQQAMAVLEEVKKKANTETTEYSEITSESVKILLSMANLHYDKQEYKEAEELLDKGIEIINRNLGGENHPLYPNFLSLAANAKLNKKNYSGAEECYRKVVDLKLKQKQPPSGMMTTYQSLAVCLDRQGKYSEAIEQYQKVLGILQESFKDDLEKQITVTRAIASAYTKTDPKDFGSAEKYFAQAEQLILKKTGNDNNIEYGEILNDLGACRIQLQKYEDAILNFAACERIFAEFFGENHDKTITAKENLSNLRTLIQQRDVKTGCPCLIL
ncbi:hypothetical protein FDP41_009508 [Naegleria fowleri]|uniref:Uncharacterized protein n=1 Tax=Naegleria fowleri TaxID=5763 RepID=A0A6A5BDR4_NAEFO|nr:uncharacterized protein FDP41_009508 [Naegleria fowleri]KAF0972200.1 hypothetical protein FDP41_009508 [Naegleria fowleri]